jgi:hypothetical protein
MTFDMTFFIKIYLDFLINFTLFWQVMRLDLTFPKKNDFWNKPGVTKCLENLEKVS